MRWSWGNHFCAGLLWETNESTTSAVHHFCIVLSWYHLQQIAEHGLIMMPMGEKAI